MISELRRSSSYGVTHVRIMLPAIATVIFFFKMLSIVNEEALNKIIPSEGISLMFFF